MSGNLIAVNRKDIQEGTYLALVGLHILEWERLMKEGLIYVSWRYGFVEEPDDQWISAKEQSPEDFNNVLIVVDGEVMEGYFLRNHRGWYSRDGKIQFGVTHWQPLPEPPEEEA